ncbi:MAG TPA: 7TM diverse intracellular signaling domain-containing protein [Oligoflexus sp.]|uniref:7TM diverse intracellular signaling domain-containing protein n=1 Tax=Oligoflexus sp. TaxID=1971216 RepID=UPI002D3520C3|nr:7TM diverse intracellular signaling domain-containing protein [Oligoflexus sp.]HYX32962.1 7TM diverse intracellular signaling domain-containing protein [Oligoflexus sp.]
MDVLHYFRFFILIWSTFVISSASLRADVIDISEPLDGKPLGSLTFWYRGEESIDRVTDEAFRPDFVRGTSAVINHGYSSANYWYRLAFYNSFEGSAKIYLHDPHNVYDDFEVYQGADLLSSLHYRDALDQRIVTIELPAKKTTWIYVRKKTNAVVHQTTFTFWSDSNALRKSIHASEMRFQTVITSLLMSAFFTVALVFAYRKKIYVYYLGYLMSFAIFATWVWSVYDFPNYSRYGGVLSLFCVVFTALFVDEFLEIKRHSETMHRLFLVFAGLSVGATGLELVNPIARAYAGSILSIVIQASTVWMGFSLYYKYRQPHVMIFNAAFGSFLISGFIQLLIWMGSIDSSENLIMFYGVAAENVLMVLAIGHKILVTEAARKQTDNLLLHSFDQLSKVFYPHQILQIRAGKRVEETMPVGEKKACILYFQIMGGSALMNESYEEWVENFMIRCRQLLMERYDPLTFYSDAYIVREMGDGFLCSIGYPFHQIGAIKADSAVLLAEKLIAEFEVMLAALDAAHDIHCSIGIVHGSVKSYFSRSGRIRDNLWGRAIALASAYGASSTRLFSHLEREPRNVIILHDAVFESLSRNNRRDFQVLDLAASQSILGEDLDGDFLGYRVCDSGCGTARINTSLSS